MKKIYKEMNQGDLADKLHISRTYLNGILKKKVKCSILLALRIEKESGGTYKAVDLRPDIKPYL